MTNTTRHTPQPAVQLPPSSTHRPRRTHRILAIGAATLTLGCVGYIASDEVGSDESVRTASITDVREIVVDVGAGPVSLVGDPGRAVGIRSTLHGSATGTPSADHIVVDGVLRITTSCRGLALTCHVDQDITVPAGIPVTVLTTAGTVDANGLDVPRFQVTTSAGSVTASFARAPQAVRIETAAGNVALQLPDVGYRVHADTAVGPTQIDVAHDPASDRSLSIDTAAGRILVLPTDGHGVTPARLMGSIARMQRDVQGADKKDGHR